MRVPINLANHFSNVDLGSVPINEMLARIGAQLGAVEEVIDWSKRFDKAVVVKVVSCLKHEGADKLNVCLVDDGGVTEKIERNKDGFVQVVCGAPNVRQGIHAIWLPPGATVPSSIDKDPFVLGARELRGVISNGMLASSHELGLSDDHDGILELDTTIQPGTAFGSVNGVADVIIDCENKMFTHRPDCFGVLGVARELAGICGLQFKSPDWYSLEAVNAAPVTGNLPLVSKNDIVEQVPRFMVQVVENITVKPSRLEVQTALARLGSRPVNNLVDATNYYMHITAQPTHAFDYDKVKALCRDQVAIFPRMATEGEKLELLNGKTVTLTANDIVIATDQQAIALGGVMGGAATEVDQNTKNIIIECANFDMYTIRRTSMRHGIFSDAVTRFNKGQSHLQNPVVLAKLVQDICSDTAGTAGQLFDSAPEEDGFTRPPVSASTDFINSRLGSRLNADQIQAFLQTVEFQVAINGQDIVVTPPFWRKDIELAEDIVEEVGRLYGFDKLPITLPRRSTAAVAKNQLLELQSIVRNLLSKAGANEVLSYSFVSGKLIESAGQGTKEAYQLSNALSPELQYYRLTLTPSLLSKVQQNIKTGYGSFALFELGKTHLKLQGVNDEGLPQENDMLALVVAASDKQVNPSNGAAYYLARTYLDYLAEHLGLQLDYHPLRDATYEIARPFEPGRSALVTDRITGSYIGIVGEYKSSVRKRLKLPEYTAGFEIMTAPILEVKAKNSYRPLTKFPGTNQDISFKMSTDISYQDSHTALTQAVANSSIEHGYVVSTIPLDIYHNDKSKLKHITFRLTVHHPERSVTTEEITKFTDQVARFAEKAAKIERI